MYTTSTLKQQIKFRIQRIKNIYHLIKSIYWVIKCGYPARKMTVIGITGTDGKTTTCSILYEVLKAAGIKAGVLTTVAARYTDRSGKEIEIETGLHTTNPDAGLLQPILKRMVDDGVTHLVLEVTAHGIDQHRIWGTNMKIGVLTNISHEHLDDFLNMEIYKRTKLKMFSAVSWAVLNMTDPVYGEFTKQISEWGGKVVGYKKVNYKNISPVLVGDYNKENLAAVEAVARILEIPEKTVKDVAFNFAGVSGRREEVIAGQKFRVVVDFAHTPNALERVLKQLKSEVGEGGKLIAVFGCTGERDEGKRPKMGQVATELADIVIITSDDTRSESQDTICIQIMAGIKDKEERMRKGVLIKENDRRKAIAQAISMVKTKDIILLAGKGHEKSILIGKVERPWSDAGVATELILEKKDNGFNTV